MGWCQGETTYTGIAALKSRKFLGRQKRVIKCYMPTTVHLVLNTLSNVFLTKFSRYCFSYQMLHLCSLVLEIRFDLA